MLNWDAVGGASGYRVDRRCGTGDYVELTTLPATVTTYTDGYVPTTDMTCVYRVRTVHGALTSSGTESQPIRLPGISIPDPASVTATLTGNAVTVNWTAVDGAFEYWLDRKCSAQDNHPLMHQMIANTVTQYVDTSPVAGTTCTYRVSVTIGDFTSTGKDSNPVAIP